MNYERVLLMIKDRAIATKSLINETEGRINDDRYISISTFLYRALKNLKEEFDELNAAHSIIEKENVF